MTIQIPQNGNPKPLIFNLTTTTKTTIYTGQSNIRGILNSITACNDSAGAGTVSLFLADPSGSEVYIYSQVPVASKQTLLVTQHEIPIPEGWTLSVKAETGTFDIVAVIVELVSTKG